MANNLKDHLQEVADAIRAKKGTTDLINHQYFSAEIASIEGGGSGGESGSNIEYLDVSGLDSVMKNQLMMVSLIARTSQFEMIGQVQDPLILIPSSLLVFMASDSTAYESYSSAVNAIGVDFTMQLKSQSTTDTVLDEVKKMPVYEQLDSIPRLTKEQFYDLNA